MPRVTANPAGTKGLCGRPPCSAVPPGLGGFSPANPALKCWAIFDRMASNRIRDLCKTPVAALCERRRERIYKQQHGGHRPPLQRNKRFAEISIWVSNARRGQPPGVAIKSQYQVMICQMQRSSKLRRLPFSWANEIIKPILSLSLIHI